MTALGPTRRSLASAGALLVSLGALAACNPLQSAWAFKRYYRYRVQLEVDGRPIDVSNGGVVTGSRGWAGGGGYVFDFPMPSVVRLDSGELLLVQPPKINLPLDRAVGATKTYRDVEHAPYLPGQMPSVFLFDSAKPGRVDAHVMAAALADEGMRVKLVAVGNEFVDLNSRKSIADEVPWLAPALTLTEARLRRGIEGYWADLSDVRSEFDETIVQGGSFKGQLKPLLFAWVCTILTPQRDVAPQLLRGLEPALGENYRSVREAIERGESVHVPLTRGQGAKERKLQWPTDPRVIAFGPIHKSDIEWARTQPYPKHHPEEIFRYLHLMSESFTADPLGTLEFKKTPNDFARWTSRDGSLDLMVGYAQLDVVGNKIGGVWRSGEGRNTIVT